MTASTCWPGSEREQRAWQWPEELTVSQWAAKCRVLAPGVTPEPGPWNNERTPYLRGLMDVLHEPGVQEIVFVKPVQVGGSEALRNILGYWIDCDPGPCLWVLPDEKSARDAISERIKPMLDVSPVLRRHVSDRAWDTKQTRIRLDTMEVYVGWAGSPQSLASRPCRYVVFDECDKYPPFSGREASPIALGTERSATYMHRRRILKISTPTTREGAICQAFDSCGDKRFYQVPCPHCGHHQRLVWPKVKWPKGMGGTEKIKHAEQIEKYRLAWYECERCQGKIEDAHRGKILAEGIWVPVGMHVGLDGALVGERPVSRSVGLHLSSLYSPWRSFSSAVAEWLRVDGQPGGTMNFYNSWLAEPFEVQVAKTQPHVIREKAAGGPEPRIVPEWAGILIATADTQKDHFYFTIRAWGYEYRSQLVDRGICATFDELYARTIQATYRVGTTGAFASPSMLLIDSGGTTGEYGTSRTNEVYQFTLRDPARVHPIKGANRSLNFIVSFHWQKDHGVQLWEIDTEQAKDLLTRLIHDPDPIKWLPNSAVDDDYCSQMASEAKVIDPKTHKMEWRTKTSGAPNHWWDCEAYQAAAAMYVGAGQRAPEPQPNAPVPQVPQMESFVNRRGPDTQPTAPAGNFAAAGSGWKMKTW